MDALTTQNKVFVTKQGIVEIQVCGDQTIDSVQRMGQEALGLCRQQRQDGQRALILDNLFDMGTVPTAARRRVVELVKSTEYDKLAMVGSSRMLRLGANLMLRASGRGSQVRYFESYVSAEQWLLA